ncbi:MAG TPA: hypothetical protein VGG48_12545 [Rhizomicrobium sp.]|jgi:hypothetical protein
MNAKKWSILAGAAVATVLWGPEAAIAGAILGKRLHDKVMSDAEEEADAIQVNTRQPSD